jgi:hypothetical protein
MFIFSIVFMYIFITYFYFCIHTYRGECLCVYMGTKKNTMKEYSILQKHLHLVATILPQMKFYKGDTYIKKSLQQDQ